MGKTVARVLAPDDTNVFGKAGTSGPAFAKALTGKKVIGVGRQGKYFWLLLDQPPHPVMHLGMTGWIHIRGQQTAYNRYEERSKGADKDQWPPRFWKFHLETDGGGGADQPKVEVAFTDARRFGRVRLVDCAASEIRKQSPLVENGPDPVIDRDEFTEKYLRQRMRGRRVPIKALLLDQAVVSGIGNWVGDEIMYQARLHPGQYCDDLGDADVAALYRAVCYVCDTAVEKLGDSAEFPADWLFEHRWGKGKKGAATALPNGEKLTFVTVGGRTSCVVPGVQKLKPSRATNGDVGVDVKDEDEEAADAAVESRFFEPKKKDKKTKAARQAAVDVAEEYPPKKKARPSRSKTSIKEEPDADPPTLEPERIPEEKKADAKEPVQTIPVVGSRRSTRLNGTR